MFEASVQQERRYANINKLAYLKSKLSGDALEAIAGIKIMSNEDYKIFVEVI